MHATEASPRLGDRPRLLAFPIRPLQPAPGASCEAPPQLIGCPPPLPAASIRLSWPLYRTRLRPLPALRRRLAPGALSAALCPRRPVAAPCLGRLRYWPWLLRGPQRQAGPAVSGGALSRRVASPLPSLTASLSSERPPEWLRICPLPGPQPQLSRLPPWRPPLLEMAPHRLRLPLGFA